MAKDSGGGMKSAYEAALARLEAAGIEPPQSAALPSAVKEEMAEVRRRAAAKLAELELLYHDRRRKAGDTLGEEAEEEYLRERRHIEDERERKLQALRQRVASS